VKKTALHRRDFLRGSLAAGAGLATLGGLNPLQQLSYAQQMNPDAPDRYYIFCYFSGGWDVLLGLDPRDPREFPSETESLRHTRIQPGYETLQLPDADIIRVNDQISFGPFIGDLQYHADKMTIIRGMNMESVAHEGGRRRFLTGKPPSGTLARGSSGATWLAGQFGGGELVPNLSLRVESYNKDMPNYATALRVSAVPDLLRALRPAEPLLSPRLRRQLGLALSDAAKCPEAKASTTWGKAEYTRQKAQQMVSEQIDSLFDFGGQTPAMRQIREHYGFNQVGNSPGVSAALAAKAITSGVSRCVSVAITGGLDSHQGPEWSQQQGPRQQAGFDAIAKMVDDLVNTPHPSGEGSWFDRTYIVGFSEFSRTPLLNSSGGRDHHITNSCFVMGGNIRGGQIIGGSTDVGMEAALVDRISGQVSAEGEIIKPEHVWRTLFDEVGIDDSPDLRVQRLETLLRA
jgi:hypothetical protein